MLQGILDTIYLIFIFSLGIAFEIMTLLGVPTSNFVVVLPMILGPILEFLTYMFMLFDPSVRFPG